MRTPPKSKATSHETELAGMERLAKKAALRKKKQKRRRKRRKMNASSLRVFSIKKRRTKRSTRRKLLRTRRLRSINQKYRILLRKILLI